MTMFYEYNDIINTKTNTVSVNPQFKQRFDKNGNQNIYGKYDINGIYRGNDYYYKLIKNEEEEEEEEDDMSSSGEYPEDYYESENEENDINLTTTTTTNPCISSLSSIVKFETTQQQQEQQQQHISHILNFDFNNNINNSTNNEVYFKYNEYCDSCMNNNNNNSIKIEPTNEKRTILSIQNVIKNHCNSIQDTYLQLQLIKNIMLQYDLISTNKMAQSNELISILSPPHNNNNIKSKKRKENDNQNLITIEEEKNNKRIKLNDTKKEEEIYIYNNSEDEDDYIIDKEYRLRIGNTDCFNCILCDSIKLKAIRIDAWNTHCELYLHKRLREEYILENNINKSDIT